MKKFIFFSHTLFVAVFVVLWVIPLGVDAKTTILTHIPHDNLGYCFGPQEFEVYRFDEDNVCYVVKSGDTLWDISEFYLGDGMRWQEMRITEEYRRNRDAVNVLNDPRELQVGTKIVFNTSSLKPFIGFRSVRGSALVDPETERLMTVSYHQNGSRIVNVDDEIYGGPYLGVKHMRASSDGQNITYLAEEEGFCSGSENRYRLYINGLANTHCITGYDLKLLVFTEHNNQYAVRNNTNTDPEQFLVLSSIGNSDAYDYIDSLFWIDNDTLVYRAQIDDVWRVVVNHKDYVVYDYLENLLGENGIISFDARHSDQSWTHESLVVSGK